MTRTMPSRRKAFISAPLIGTVIFLSAVVFVVNLQNIEAQASLRVANDAYHNRIASVLEQHRSDLASIFREGLSRTISYYLLDPGWDVFVWTNNPASTFYASDDPQFGRRNIGEPDPGLDGIRFADGSYLDGPPDQRVSLKELKFGKCDTVRALTSDVICSIPDTGGGSITGATEYKYGLPQWMSKFVENDGTIVFEGITFNTSNPEQVKVFLPNDRGTGVSQTQALQEYQDYCNALLRGSVFDCKAYATQTDPRTGESKMQCADDLNGDGTIQENEVLKGCEDGRFFVKVNVENPVGGVEVYPKLPRVEARDTGGNVFRSSGIGEKNFYLPINLRIFKYFQDTMGVYGQLAYGPSGDTGSSAGASGNEGKQEGVADGYCGETKPTQCVRQDPEYKDEGYKLAGINPNDPNAIQNKVASDFFDLVFKRACPQLPTQNTELFFCTSSDCASAPKCDDNIQFASFSGTTGSFANRLCSNPGEGEALFCAYYPNAKFDFKLVDNDAAFRIDPQKPITFKWGAEIQHDLPSP